MYCPKCGTEYRQRLTRCADCDFQLADERPSDISREYPPQDEPDVILGAYTMPYEADIVKGLLAAKEIPSRLMDYHTIYINWLYSNALGGVKVQVPQSHIEQALSLLVDACYQHDHPSEFYNEGLCPHCGHTEAQYVLRGKKWAFLTWLVVGYPLVWPWARYRCFNCGHYWRANE